MKELLAKIPFGLILVLYLGYIGFDYYSFISASDSPLLQKKVQIDAAKKESLQIQAKIKQNAEFFKNLEAKKSQLRDMALKLDEMKATVSDDLDVPGFIKNVITEAKKIGLTVTSLKPGRSVSKEFFAEQSFDLAFRGVYVQLVVFLERLSNMQKIIRIDNFDIHPMSSSSSSRYVELEGVLELKAYRYLASKADEIARSGGAEAATNAATSKPAPGGASR